MKGQGGLKSAYPNEIDPIPPTVLYLIIYYQAKKRELKRRPIYEYRCDERLKVKDEGSTRLGYTG